MILTTRTALAMAIAALFAGAALAQEQSDATAEDQSAETPEKIVTGDRADIAAARDGEWVTITGTVLESAEDSFVLGYRHSQVIVEMDDYDWYDADVFEVGDRLTVSGPLDALFYHDAIIDAVSVYRKSTNEFFFSTAERQEIASQRMPMVGYPEGDEWLMLTGKVTAITGEGFILDAGLYEYDVDTAGIGLDLLDVEAAEKIDVGDRVVVTGEMDERGLFEDRELDASSVMVVSGPS